MQAFAGENEDSMRKKWNDFDGIQVDNFFLYTHTQTNIECVASAE